MDHDHSNPEEGPDELVDRAETAESVQRRVSPYLMLGIPHGATLAEARAGFLVATKRLSESAVRPFGLEDLTWALHQIEQGISQPFTLRIPADPKLVECRGSGGLFDRPAKPMTRRTEAPDSQTRTRYEQRAMQNAARSLLERATCYPNSPEVYEIVPS